LPTYTRFTLLLSLLLSINTVVFAATKRAPSNQLPLFYEEISKNEIDEAKAISSFVTQLRRLNLDDWSLKRLSRIKNPSIMPAHQEIIELAKTIKNSKSYDSFTQVCGKA